MADAKISGVALGAIAAGALFLYAGIKGKSVLTSAQYLISGKNPASSPAANQITQVTETGTGAGSVAGLAGSAAGQQIAADALAWAGPCYALGGAPGPDGSGCWDCSSFVNYVVGVQAGLAIPEFGRGQYTGSVHGPATTTWLVWTGCETIATNSTAKAQAGDLIVGITHMGIYTSGGDYMSAHDPAEATSNKAVSSFPDPVYLVRRLRAVTG